MNRNIRADNMVASSISGTAKSANLSTDFIRKEIREGRLEAKKAGRRTIITHAARDRWLASLPVVSPKRPVST